MSMNAQHISLFAVAVSGRTLTPSGTVAINDLRPRTPVGALTFTGIVNGAIFDLYAQAQPSNQYSLLALPTGTSVVGRTDVVPIGEVIDRPSLGTIQWIPLTGGSLDALIYAASDGIHFRVVAAIGYGQMTMESPTRASDLLFFSQDSGATIRSTAGMGIDAPNGFAAVSGYSAQVTANTGTIELFQANGVLFHPANAFVATGRNISIDPFGHLVASQGALPTIVAGAGAGSGASASVIAGSTDLDGCVSVVTAGTPTGANATVATVSFRGALAANPRKVSIEPANAAAANLSRAQDCYAPRTLIGTGGWGIASGATALAAGATYEWWYEVAA